jgi:hypothetical protein
MLENRRLRVALTAVVLLSGAVLAAQDKPAEFYFGGKRIFVGMPQVEALSALSTCCRLSPNTVTVTQRQALAKVGKMAGQMILPKDESETRILATIFFGSGKVVSLTRPLGEEAYVPWNEDVLGFARTLQRALSPSTGDSDTTVRISVRHERSSNAETEVLSLAFSNGRGVRFNIIRLDKAFEGAPPESRDQVTLDEFLE